MDIPVGLYIEEDLSMRRLLIIVYTTETPNDVLDGAVVEENNLWSKM